MLLAKEVLKEIREAEKTAENLVKQSQINAREILKTADDNAKKILDAASADARNISSKLISEKEAEAKESAREIIEKAKMECDALKSIPAEKSENAVKLVIERIVKPYGNS